jgi:hypothetical protein
MVDFVTKGKGQGIFEVKGEGHSFVRGDFGIHAVTNLTLVKGRFFFTRTIFFYQNHFFSGNTSRSKFKVALTLIKL